MDKDKVRAFTQKCFQDMAGAMTAGLAYVGTRTGLFRAMAHRGPMTLEAVVQASGLEPRYVDEWLKGMVSAGYLDFDPELGSYELPDEHAFLLASDGTDHFAGGLFFMAPTLLAAAPKVADAFAAGGGVEFPDYGAEGRQALDLINRGNYQHRLVNYWLKALPDVIDQLEAGVHALDVGCGVGHVSLSLAAAFPNSRFVGVDIDTMSIEQARSNAEQRGLAERVQFNAGTLEEVFSDESFDFITACDCVHDFADPSRILANVKSRLNPDGTFLVIEPKSADRLEDNCHPIGTMFYGFSVFHCMTQSLAAGGPGLGTCMGPARLTSLMTEAGFTRCETLDIKSQVNMFFAVRH